METPSVRVLSEHFPDGLVINAADFKHGVHTLADPADAVLVSAPPPPAAVDPALEEMEERLLLETDRADVAEDALAKAEAEIDALKAEMEALRGGAKK